MAQVIMHYIKRAIMVWTGLVFISLGVAGSLIPIFPGFILVILGIGLISRSAKQSIIDRLKAMRDSICANRSRITKRVRVGLQVK